MLEIKTIIIDPVDSAKFDEQVNEALAEGWVLVRRDLLLKPNALYAELERVGDTEGQKRRGTAEVDRTCENCKHFEKSCHTNPCALCEDVNGIPDQWEAGE
jgi:hypothetical protein